MMRLLLDQNIIEMNMETVYQKKSKQTRQSLHTVINAVIKIATMAVTVGNRQYSQVNQQRFLLTETNLFSSLLNSQHLYL